MKTQDVAVGSIYELLSRVVLVVCGFLVHIVLARKLGPELFGLYTLILSVLVWVESSVSMGIPTVFRKMISENKNLISPIVNLTRKLSVPYCLAITFLFALSSPFVAAALNDDRLILLFIVASLDIPFFGMYATYMGILNGHGQFLLHSVLAALYSIARTAVIVSAIVLGFGVTGALIGNAIGSLCGLVLALHYARSLATGHDGRIAVKTAQSNLDIKPRLMSFGIPYLSYYLLTSVLIHLDIWFVKALTVNQGAADEQVGYYAAAYNLARVPFFLMTAITVTIFPAVSKAVFEDRMQDAQQMIKQLLRMVLILLVPLIVVVFSTADRLVALVFGPAYLPAGESFRFLFLGISLFSIFLFFANIMAAENKPQLGVRVSLLLIPIAAMANYFLINIYGILGAALATGAVSSIGLLITGAYVWNRFGSFIDVTTLGRLSIAGACVFFASEYEGLYQYHLLAGYAALALIYGALLLALQEVDIRSMKALLMSLRKTRLSSSR